MKPLMLVSPRGDGAAPLGTFMVMLLLLGADPAGGVLRDVLEDSKTWDTLGQSILMRQNGGAAAEQGREQHLSKQRSGLTSARGTGGRHPRHVVGTSHVSGYRTQLPRQHLVGHESSQRNSMAFSGPVASNLALGPRNERQSEACRARGSDASWASTGWVIHNEQRCPILDMPKDAPWVNSCLANKTIAFVGDSHLRNLFRCVADHLTAGEAAEAIGHYSASVNAEWYPDDWPKYWHMDMKIPPNDARSNHIVAGMHKLSCHNANKVHRHDYTFDVAGSSGKGPRLKFFWLPWSGNKPLIETPGVVEQMGLELAKYKFNYTGGRARGTFLPRLRDTWHPDLVVSGGEARDHSMLFETFPSSAVLVNHAGLSDGLDAEAARHGVPMVDVSNPLLSVMPDFHAPRETGSFGVHRTRHPPPEVLQLQSRLLLTLVAEKLCPERSSLSEIKKLQ